MDILLFDPFAAKFDSRLKKQEASLDSEMFDQRTVDSHRAGIAWKAWRSGVSREGQSIVFEAVLWIACTGSPWRDLPAEFGKWFTVYTRFWRWAHKGVGKRVFEALSND